MEPKVVIFAGLIPGTLIGAGTLIAWMLASKRERPDSQSQRPGPRWIAPLLILLAFFPADYAVKSFPTLWTDNAAYRHPHAMVLLALPALLYGLLRLPWWIRLPLRAAAVGGALWMLGWPYVVSGVTPRQQFWTWTILAVVLAPLTIEAADRAAVHLTGPAFSAAFLPTAMAVPAACFFFGSAYVAQSGALLVAASTALLVVGLLVRRLQLDRGAVGALLAACYTFILGTLFQYDPRSLVSLLLVGIAPALLLVAAVPPLRDKSAWIRTLVAAGATLVPIGIAVLLGYQAWPRDQY